MWFAFGLVTLLASTVFMYFRRRADRWTGDVVGPGVRLRRQYNSKTRRHVGATLGIDFDTEIEFECRRESAFARLLKRFGLAGELQSGQRGFDDDVYLVCDDPRMRTLLRGAGGLPGQLLQLVTAAPPQFTLKRLVCRGGSLRAEYRTNGGDPQALLKEALPQLQALAAALPRASGYVERQRDPLFLRSVLVLAMSSALAINGVVQILRLVLSDDTIIVDRGRLWLLGLLAGAGLLLALVLLTVRLLIGTSRLPLVLAEVLLVGTFGCFASGVNLVRDANTAFDFASAQPLPAMVGYMETRVTHSRRGRSTSYYVTYHGVDLPDDGRIRVSSSQYGRMRTAMRVVVNFHDGALGIRWVSSIDPAPYAFELPER